MKIRKGQKRIKVPPIGIMDLVCVKTATGPTAMRNVVFGDAIDGEDEHGTPEMWALDADHRHLIVRPTPDKATEIYLRYFPPMQEA
ncbi:MAG: hypothetical protein KAI73_02160 [Rhodospirillaceae bacterium]|nr:hypothetical protein [Rhodospirillaceae bacterium]